MTRDEMMTALKQAQGFIDGRAKMAGVGDGTMLLYSWFRAIEMAIREMDAQQPRVLIPEEIRLMIGKPAWLETRRGRVYTGWALVYDIQKGMGITGERMGITQPNGRVSWFLRTQDYGKTWRLWTSAPTDAQKEGTAWKPCSG